MSVKKISVLICDDSALMRKNLRAIIESSPDLEVIGIARDGEEAVVKARELNPDVITMDINMPRLDGITALQIIVDEQIAPVLMVSSLTQEGATVTFEAMALGAFDYVAKPDGTVSVHMQALAHEIVEKIKAAARPGTMRRLSRKSSTSENLKKALKTERVVRESKPRNTTGFKAVAIGISTGGPKTIFDVLPFLPGDLNAAVFLVQHMPANFLSSFAERIDSKCQMKCVEAEAGKTVEPGYIYLGRGGYHLTLYQKLTKQISIRNTTKPDHLFMPSVDVMMSSVFDVFGRDTIGVLMTGMGDDGADSMVKINQGGGITIAESEETAIVFGMPKEAIDRGGARIVRPSWEIADEIIKAVR
ncbi:chemotaxis response regulator protein-glutamate methylesterase [candidate division KSB1 bacterium]|nr:chemotaxis response regulator protein-glutamate methylesterase [candidate division KSB1 bacterium]